MNADRSPRKAAAVNTGHRSRGRELALKYLYHHDARRGVEPESFEAFAVALEEGGMTAIFARELVEGVLAKREQIDADIRKLAKNWTLARMPILDRNIIRIGAYELLFTTDTPPGVVINEAVELGKRFSTAQSGKFINGILDKLRPRPTDSARKADTPDDGGETRE